jgi:hypothetical protein
MSEESQSTSKMKKALFMDGEKNGEHQVTVNSGLVNEVIAMNHYQIFETNP